MPMGYLQGFFASCGLFSAEGKWFDKTRDLARHIEISRQLDVQISDEKSLVVARPLLVETGIATPF